MNKELDESTQWQQKAKRNTNLLKAWTFTWLVTSAIAAFAPKFIWDFNTTLTILAVLLNLGVGFKMILVNRQHLNGLDEMQRKIQTDAMGLTLGTGLVVGLSYELLEDIKLITFEPEISHLVIIMALTYLIGIIVGGVKYR